VEILAKQLEKYREVRDWDFVHNIHDTIEEDLSNENTRKFYWDHGEAHFAFSKHKGKSIYQVARQDKEFLRWMLTADFSQETKSIVKNAIGEDEKK